MIRSEIEGRYLSNANLNEYNNFDAMETIQQPIIEQNNYQQNGRNSNVVDITPTDTLTTNTSATNEVTRTVKVPVEDYATKPPEMDKQNLTFTGPPAVQVDVNVNFG